MRLLLVITELEEGGAENALFHVARRAALWGDSVAVAALFAAKGATGIGLMRSVIPVYELGISRPWHLHRAARLRRLIDDFRPDLVHSWLFHANMCARMVTPPSVPLLCSLRVSEPRMSHILLDRWTRRRVARYLCVSNSVAEFARRHVGVRDDAITVIQNGVDTDLFKPSETPRQTPDAIRGVSVGRLTEQKGFDILLKGLAELPPDVAWEWNFIGPSPSPEYAAALRSLVQELGIAENVTFTGPIEREAMPDCYRSADLLALPSRWEGQPNVVLEALACCLPVLCADTDGVRDLVAQEPQALRVVAPNTPEAWCDAIADAWRKRDGLRAPNQAARRLVAERTWDSVARQHLAAYKSILGGTSSTVKPPQGG